MSSCCVVLILSVAASVRYRAVHVERTTGKSCFTSRFIGEYKYRSPEGPAPTAACLWKPRNPAVGSNPSPGIQG